MSGTEFLSRSFPGWLCDFSCVEMRLSLLGCWLCAASAVLLLRRGAVPGALAELREEDEARRGTEHETKHLSEIVTWPDTG